MYSDDGTSRRRFSELLSDLSAMEKLSKNIVKYPNPIGKNYLVLDIETYPSKSVSEFILNYYQERRWNKKIPKEKKPKKSASEEEILKLKEEFTNAQKEYKEVIQIDKCIEPPLGEIVLICLKTPYWKRAIYGEGEKSILERFWNIAFVFRQTIMPIFVTFNGLNFDVPMIELRSSILGIDKFSLPKRRYDLSHHFDVRMVLTRWNQYGLGDLTFWGEVFGFKRPSDFVDGSDLMKYYEKGDMETYVKHCWSDIDITENVFLRLL